MKKKMRKKKGKKKEKRKGMGNRGECFFRREKDFEKKK
jgi:hypothetical protein